MTDTIKLTYHGNTYTAVRCGHTVPKGRAQPKTLYYIAMKSSAVIAYPGTSFDNGVKQARGFVLNAVTSTGTSLENLAAIEWDGPGAENAKLWAARQCELAASISEDAAGRRSTTPEVRVKVAAKASAYREMVAKLRER